MCGVAGEGEKRLWAALLEGCLIGPSSYLVVTLSGI